MSRSLPAWDNTEVPMKLNWPMNWVISHLLQLSFSSSPLFLATISTQLHSPLVTLQKAPGKGAHGTWIPPTSQAFKKVLYCLTSVSAFPSSMGLCPVTLSSWLAELCALPSPGSDLPGATADSSSLSHALDHSASWLSDTIQPFQLLCFTLNSSHLPPMPSRSCLPPAACKFFPSRFGHCTPADK